jgi:hypothetical protein
MTSAESDAGPLLIPAPRAGAGVAVARTLRLTVTAEGLVLTHPGGHREVLCGPGTVRRIIHLQRHHRGQLPLDHVLIVGDGQAWALPLPAWTPGWEPRTVLWPRRERLAVAGVTGLAEALGASLVLSGADQGTLADVAGVPPSPYRPQPQAPLVAAIRCRPGAAIIGVLV